MPEQEQWRDIQDLQFMITCSLFDKETLASLARGNTIVIGKQSWALEDNIRIKKHPVHPRVRKWCLEIESQVIQNIKKQFIFGLLWVNNSYILFIFHDIVNNFVQKTEV